MSLSDILQLEKDRINREKVVFRTVYERLKNRVNNSAKVGSKYCVYTIPEFIIGYPLTNVEKTMIYLNKKLKKEGFYSMPISRLEILVLWDPNQIKLLSKGTNDSKVSLTQQMTIRDDDDLIQSMINAKKNQRF